MTEEAKSREWSRQGGWVVVVVVLDMLDGGASTAAPEAASLPDGVDSILLFEESFASAPTAAPTASSRRCRRSRFFLAIVSSAKVKVK